ncbi:hypothetical protein KFE98_09590 [bacterium SCSIO 12741]|nr:hypothetical protein KFE98_09590 [bacterium SCSIO 12741]
MDRIKLILGSILLLAVVATGCKGVFGEKTDLEFIDKPVYTGREVAYVPIQPVLDNFARPTQVLAGFDQLMYILDGGSEEIVSMDLSGRELHRVKIPGLKAIAQDRTLDLLASGTYDTLVTVNGQPQTLTLACIYRIHQSSGISHGLQHAQITPVIIHPYYKNIPTAIVEDQEITFEGIGVLGNSNYYITRNGPNQNTGQLGGPDDAVLLVGPDLLTGEKDKFISPLIVQTPSGSVLDYFSRPVGISTLAQPPQNAAITDSRDFLFTSVDPDLSLKVQYIKYEESENGGVYFLDELDSKDTSKADGFLYEANKFSAPRGVTYAGDGTNYIFVVDSEKDSLYQFTSKGYEGVNPPPFSAESKQILASFGGRGQDLRQFNNPTGVAYLNKILYVADAGNGRVLRFKLTTDFD